VLLHEKPFAGVNGSGKHNNWSLSTDTGVNLLDPGDEPHTTCSSWSSCARSSRRSTPRRPAARLDRRAGNDHRLGANEAPPAIISIFLGDMLTDIVEQLERGQAASTKKGGRLDLGARTLPADLRGTPATATAPAPSPSPATSSSSAPWAQPRPASPGRTPCSTPSSPSRSTTWLKSEVDRLVELTRQCHTRVAELERSLENEPASLTRHAQHVRDKVKPAMDAVREIADQLEQHVAADLWQLPKYQEMLIVK
jgi:glutamine synthetase type III